MTNLQRAYKEKMEGQLKESQAKIQGLRAKVQTMSGDAKIAYEKRLLELEQSGNDLSTRLGAIRDMAEDSWTQFREDLDQRMNEWKAKYNDLIK